MSTQQDIYKPCAHLRTKTPDATVDKELMKRIGSEYKTLPTFEQTAFEFKFVKHYSFENNEKLKCRWQQYRDNIDKKVFAPFQFPDVRDLHFYNGTIRFIPSLSITRASEHKKKLKPGPRVDWRGQAPIPYEMLMRRGLARSDDKPPPAAPATPAADEEKHDKHNANKDAKIYGKKALKIDAKKVVKDGKKSKGHPKEKEK